VGSAHTAHWHRYGKPTAAYCVNNALLLSKTQLFQWQQLNVYHA